jgi:hypothetical protein
MAERDREQAPQSEVFGTEEALARGFVDFNNPTGNKLFTLTDVTPEEIFGLPTILILGKWFKSKIVDDWVEKFLLLRQSRFRLGRREFMMTATGIREAGEAKKKEKLTNVFAGLK